MRKMLELLGLVTIVILLPLAVMAQQPVRWEATLDNAQRLAGQTNRLVLIHFWAPWCGVCKRMEAEILVEPSVAAELARDYVPVKINADHFPATARQYNVTALPTTVIITPQGQLLDTMRGRVEAAEYVARLTRVASDVKQRGGAVYAQVPQGMAPPIASVPVQPSPTTGQPRTVAAQPTGMGGPSLGAGAQPPVAASQPAGNGSSLSDERYADFFRRTQAAPVAPIAQPPLDPPGPTNAQPMMASQPPAAASVGPVYGSQSPPLAARQPTSPPISYPAMQPAAATPASQPTAISPPLALDGFCPVSLSEKQQWVAGDRRWGAIHRGRTYLFIGPEEQRRFFTDPDRYAPAVSGNDVVLATEQGQAAPGMREHGVFFGNRVYLFSCEATLEKFTRNPNQYANQALGAIRPGTYAGQPMQ